jgi:hypothetical protein
MTARSLRCCSAAFLAALLLSACAQQRVAPMLGAPPGEEESRPIASATALPPEGYAIAATNGWVYETTIAISPANPKVAVAAGMRTPVNSRGGLTQKVVETFWTDDGGASWHYSAPLPLTTSKVTYAHQGDPVVAFDRTGVAYAATLVGYPSPGQYVRSGILMWRSTDGGRTWSAPMPVVERAQEFFDDKEWIGIDTTGGPRDGTIYVAWLRVKSPRGGGPVELMFTRSTDGGFTWSEEKKIGAGGGPQFAIGPDGEVTIVYVEGLTMMSKTSRDGGETFSVPSVIAILAGPPGNLPNTEFILYPFASSDADRSTGPHRGNLYTVWAGSADAYPDRGSRLPGTIWLSRSTDTGATWSAPQRVSDPATGRDAMFPSLAVDAANGDLIIAWLDRTDDPGNRYSRIYATRSSDGGETFAPPRAFTSHVDLSGKSFVGHYNGTAAEQGVWLTAFTDVAGKMGIARLTWEEPPPSGQRRRPTRQ